MTKSRILADLGTLPYPLSTPAWRPSAALSGVSPGQDGESSHRGAPQIGALGGMDGATADFRVGARVRLRAGSRQRRGPHEDLALRGDSRGAGRRGPSAPRWWRRGRRAPGGCRAATARPPADTTPNTSRAHVDGGSGIEPRIGHSSALPVPSGPPGRTLSSYPATLL